MLTMTETHAHAVKAIATMVERKLEEMENCLLHGVTPSTGVRVIHVNDLTEEEFSLLKKSLSELRDCLAGFCSHYQIPAEESSIKKELFVKAGFLWEELSDAINRKFYGYDENQSAVMHGDYVKRIKEMILITNKIYSL